MLPDLKRDADGVLTLYISARFVGQRAPKGSDDFITFLRTEQ
jgi:hypothetical protein